LVRFNFYGAGFLLKDRCSLSDQISFILASGRRGFILAMRDRDRANKNEIEIFVFSVTSNDFPHDMLLLTFVPASSAARAQQTGRGWSDAVNVRYGSSADVEPHPLDVCFAPKSGH
jgi:hypothetical protein